MKAKIKFRGHTYTLSDTGGGIEVYERRDDEAKQTWLLTRVDDAVAPEPGDDAFLGCYDDDGYGDPINNGGEVIRAWQPDE